MPNPTISDELASLSDEAVNLLGNIIFEAEKLPNVHQTPFRALFTAYDTILAQNGIDKQNDGIYLRFLLRMAEDKRKSVDLFEKFRDLLKSVGIEVLREGEGNDERTRRLTAEELQAIREARNDSSEEPEFKSGAIGAPQKRNLGKRASSYDPVLSHISEADTARSVEAEGVDHHLIHRRRPSDTVADVLSAGYAKNGQAPSEGISSLRGRLSRRTSSDQIPIRLRTDRSTSSHGSLRIMRRSSSASRHSDQNYLREQLNPAVIEADAYGGFSATHGDFWRPSETELEEYADAFEHHHDIKLARQMLRRWNQLMQEICMKHEEMNKTAIAHDRRVLLKSGFDAVRGAYEERKRVIETERFFAHLEARAVKARDLFLLTKAFTHWAQCASDEVLRTSVARRHILRTKYFNAWREITAVNELKVRRFVLRKFIGRWRQQTINFVDAHITAMTLYERNLTARIYWQWFWGFCERRAPIWGYRKTKGAFFKKWSEHTTQLRNRENWVMRMKRHDVQRKALETWRSKLKHARNSALLANDHYKKTIGSKAISTFKKEVYLRPIAAEVAISTKCRLTRTVFSLWQHRVQTSQKAERWNRENTICKFWKIWNDNLRCGVIVARINDRVLVEALYKWILAARASLLRRVHETSVKRTLFVIWRNKTHDLRTRLETANQIARTTQKRTLFRNSLETWRSALQDLRQNEEIAVTKYNHSLLLDSLNIWIRRYYSIRQLSGWALDANFYVSSKRTLTKWKDVTKKSQRLRRRQLYVQVRTQNKLKLARRTLWKWYSAAGHVGIMENQAREIQENRLIGDTKMIIQAWLQHADDISTMRNRAMDHHRQNLLAFSFGTWSQQSRAIQELGAKADALQSGILETQMSECLRKLNWRLFQIQRQKQNALALEQRNFHKHVRIMLKYWGEQALERRHVRHSGRRDTSPSPQRDFETANHFDIESVEHQHTNDTEVIRRVVDLTELDEPAFDGGNSTANLSYFPTGMGGVEEMDIITSTPLPGYLRTPSKRVTARRRMLGRGGNSTSVPLSRGKAPATAPPIAYAYNRDMFSLGSITPFESKLVAQGFSERKVVGTQVNRLPVQFRSAARSGQSKVEFTDFEDIKEESTENPS